MHCSRKSRECRELLETLQALVDAPIVCLAEAFMRFVRDGNECVLTGTRGQPGWTNQDHFPPAAFDYLEAMAAGGGCLVDFVDPSERRSRSPEPEKEGEISWADIHRPGVGECALATAARPRERLILLLALHLHMRPAEISKLNLAQVREKFGGGLPGPGVPQAAASERRPSPSRWSNTGNAIASPTGGTPRNRCSAPPPRRPRGARCDERK